MSRVVSDGQIMPLSSPHKAANSSSRIVEIHFDPLVMHTISLLRHERKLNRYRVTMGPPEPLPVLSSTKFTLPDVQDMANEFPDGSVESLLREAVAVLVAHIGFVKMERSSLYLLSRVTAARIKGMCENLKMSHQRRVEGRETAFRSALMHTLRLENITNVVELQDFYKNRVVFYRDRVMTSCVQKHEKAAKTFAGHQARKVNAVSDRAPSKVAGCELQLGYVPTIGKTLL